MLTVRVAFWFGVATLSGMLCAGTHRVVAQTSPAPDVQMASPDAEAYGRFGAAVARVGDVNGDGFPDLLVGAPSEDGDRVGAAYVFSGRDGRPLQRLTHPDAQKQSEFGSAVARLDDADEDGRDDILVAAPKQTTGRRDPQAGQAYWMSGRSGEAFEDVESPNERANSRFGFAMAAAPDVDGDGLDDVIVSAPSEVVAEEPLTRGRVYLLSGEDGDDLATFEPPPSGVRLFGFDVAALDDVNGNGGVDVLVGIVGAKADGQDRAGSASVYDGATQSQLISVTSPNATSEGGFGEAVARIGDVNTDGVNDFAVGAPSESSADAGTSGRAYVYSGRNGQLVHALVSPTPQSNGRFGESLAGIGDVNGDGTSDVVVGAPGEASSAGRVHVFSGADGTLLRTVASPQDILNGRFGIAMSPAGDLDGDGVVDLLVGAQGETSPQGTKNAGRAYVYFAKRLGPTDEASAGGGEDGSGDTTP